MPRKGPPKRFPDGKASVDLFVNVPIYGTPVLFTVYRYARDITSENMRAAVLAQPRLAGFDTAFSGYETGLPSGIARTFTAGGKCLVVFVTDDDGDGRVVQLDNLTHECFHVAHYIAERLGFEFDQEHDEPVAYLLGWLVDALARHLMAQGFRLGADRWA